MNIVLVVSIVLLVIKVLDGYKKGMIKEIISFISLIIMSIIVILIGSGLRSYMQKEVVGVVLAILLLCILAIVHHLLSVIFFSAKMITKLPVIHGLDKILGMVVGALETVLVLWTVFSFIKYYNLGIIGEQILQYTQESSILLWLYQNNYMITMMEVAVKNMPVV